MPTAPTWPPSAVAEFAGAVLTGGASTRMGRDKALLQMEGRPLAARVAGVLALAGANPVVAVGGDLDALRSAGLVAVPDPRQGAGPLAGIATALGEVGTGNIVMVLACDLVAASPDAVRAVVAALDAEPAARVAVPVVAGRLQPLHAAWRRSALPVVETALARGDGAVRFVLEALGALPVHDLEPSWFANANSPADLRHTGSMSDAAVPEIDVEELARRKDGGAFVLDVRQPDEYEAGHVPGAVLVPLDQLEGRLGELPKGAPLLVICKSGGRSAIAVSALAGAGYDATNVAGGTMAWIESGHPVAEGPGAG